MPSPLASAEPQGPPSRAARQPDEATGAPKVTGSVTADRRQPGQAILSDAGTGLSGFASSVLAVSRRNPLEASVVVLMGLGGLLFPPIWILGAAIAVPSKIWDFRDKWVGLAGPVVLVIFGTTAAIALGGKHSAVGGYVHSAWTWAVFLSRAGAVLGAAYLGWRVRHGRRQPAVPPWNRPHRL